MSVRVAVECVAAIVAFAMPAFLRTHYQQYKRDTAQFSTWLVKTASSVGYPVSSLDRSTEAHAEEDEGPTATQVRNAKKNARKKAKAKARKGGEEGVGEGREGGGDDHGDEPAEGASAPATASNALASGNYALKVAQYTELARYVLDKGLEVPVEVVRILRRCISLRQRSLARFASTNNPANVGHRHFVDALVKILDLFSERTKVSSETDSRDTTAANRFADLTLEEVEDPEDLADIQLPGVSATDTLRATVALTAEEAVLAIIIFLQDVESIRLYVDGLWRDYKAGSVDLVTAAVTTNTALELLREPQNDLMARVMPVFEGDVDKMILVIVLALKGGIVSNSLAMSVPRFPDVRPDDFVTADVYDFTMFPVVQILGGLGALLQDQDTIPAYRAGYYGVYDPTTSVRKNDFKGRWKRYQILLTESFTDLFFLLELGNMDRSKPGVLPGSHEGSPRNAFFLDELVKSFAEFVKTKKWDFSLLAAFQIFLDINLIIGAHTIEGTKRLRSVCGRMVKMLDSRRAVEGPVAPVSWDQHNETLIKVFHLEATHWRDFDFRSLATELPGLDGSGAKFMERNPTLCGLILFRMYIKYQDIGFAMSNTWGSILCTIHLDNACRFTAIPDQPNPPKWQDVQLLIDIHGIDNVYDGPAPTNLDDAQSAFLRMSGYPRSAIAALDRFGMEGENVPHQLLDVTRSRQPLSPKSLRNRTTILPIFKRKFITDTLTGLQYDIKTIEKLLSEITSQRQQAESTAIKSEVSASTESTKGKGKAKSPNKRKLRRERKHRSPKFSVVQLLAVLEEGLRSETRSICFDYVSMHLRCLGLLKSVHDVSKEYLDRKLGRSCVSNISEVPAIVPFILHFAAMSGRASQLYLGLDRRGGMTHSRLLMGATTQLRAMLLKPGESDHETKQLECTVL